MESFDSFPNENYMNATSSFDAKKECYPQGGSECDDMISTTNSTCGSSVNGPCNPNVNKNGGIKHRTTKNKTMKHFGNVKSFRKRAKSRIIHQPPFTISDEGSLVDSSESSPHYSKSTSSSQGKKMKSLGHNKSLRTLSRTSSLRNVRVLIKKASFKPKRSLLNYPKVSEDAAVTRATFSSTLKDLKFPRPVEVRSGGGKSETKSSTKVCRYHHCSLHGHCQGAHDPVSQTKHFLYKRRSSLKKQKSVILKIEPGPDGEERSSDKKKNIQKKQIINPIAEQSESCVGICPKQDKWFLGDGYENIQESDFIELAFGEMSFPERSYKENLDISRKYSLFEQELLSGYCLRCSCHNKNNDDIRQNGFADVIKKPNEQLATLSRSNGESNKDCPGIQILLKKSTKKDMESSSASSCSQVLSDDIKPDEERNFTTESTPADDFKVKNEFTENNDLPTQEVRKLQFSKPRHVSMWNLIHQHMSSNVVPGPTNQPLEGTTKGEGLVGGVNSLLSKSTSSFGELSDLDMGTMSNDYEENQEIELRKMFAIKLVREAIEKILLPEVQDQTSEDLSVMSESSPRIEILERNQTEGNTEEQFAASVFADKDEGNMSTNPKHSSLINDNTFNSQETMQSKKAVVMISEKKAPKHWSNLKKWILLQRFIRQLEKVKKFNPKKPQHIPINPASGKVNLRSQTVDARKNAEEWMLDYAIRQAVAQLAPTQKRKVAVLVRAFETVAPTKEDDPQVQYRTLMLKSEESVFKGRGENNEEGHRESGIKMSKKTEKLCDLNDDHGDFVPSNGNSKLEDPDSEKEGYDAVKVKLEKIMVDEKATPKPQDLEENTIFNPVKGRTEESVPCIHTDKKKHIKIWHMIYQHVVSDIAGKVGSQLLDGAEDGEVGDNISCNDDYSNDFLKSTNDSSENNHVSNGFTKSDALKLVKEAVDEILLPEIQDDSSDTQSVTSDLSIMDQDISERNYNEIEEKSETQVGRKFGLLKSKNWSKLKRLILLKRSITALEKAREVKHEAEKIELRSQMVDERKKAEQWMVDYAVRHMVTKLTPARKRRVSMLVEAFEAVVPLPEM